MFVSPLSSPLNTPCEAVNLHRQVKKQRTKLQEAKHGDTEMSRADLPMTATEDDWSVWLLYYI